MKIGFIDIKVLVSTLAAFTIAGTVAAQQVSTGSAWQNEDAEFSRYDKVLIKPLDISDVIVKKPAWEQDDPEEWIFTPGIGKEIQALFMENMSREIAENGGYEVVNDKAENVLQIEVEFLSITPYARPGTRVDSSRFLFIRCPLSGQIHPPEPGREQCGIPTEHAGPSGAPGPTSAHS